MNGPTSERRRRRIYDPAVLVAIERGVAQGLTAARIEEKLKEDEGLEGKATPSARTIRDIATRLTPEDESEAWTLATDDGDETQFLLRVLRQVIWMSNGKWRQLSVAEARVLKLIRKATWDLDLDEITAYLTARRYVSLLARGESTADLDAYLAFAPWVFDQEQEDSGDGGFINAPAYQRGVAERWFENRNFQFAEELDAFLRERRVMPEADESAGSEEQAREQA